MTHMKKLIARLKNGDVRQMLREFRWIYGYARRYRWQILWYLCLGIGSTLMSLGTAVLMKRIIDAVTGFDSGVLLSAAAAYVLLQLCAIALRAWTGHISARISIRVNQQLRADIYAKVLDADWEQLSHYHSGDILNRVDNDAAAVSASVLGWAPDFVTRLVQFCAALGIILYYDATLAVLALLSAPVTLAVSAVLMPKLRSHNQQMRTISSEVMAFHSESLRNVQTIKAFGLTQSYRQKLDDLQQRDRDARLRYNQLSVSTGAFLSVVGAAVSTVCFGWGVYRLWSGHITYGTMTLFMQLAGTLSGAFSALVHMVPSAISAATAAGRIMAITELPREEAGDVRASEEFLRQHGNQAAIRAENLRFGYGDGPDVLRDARFLAKPGEIVGLVGASGEGKTTMLRLILGILRPREGNLQLEADGKVLPVSAATRRFFGYVPQGSAVFAGSVAENLRLLNPGATDEELWQALELACADHFVRRLPQGLDAQVLEQGTGFSQGQLQRICIARTLLTDQRILLLDEATSALDAKTEEKVLRSIVATGRTCIVTTHRPAVMEACTRVYRVENGTIRAQK